jgi:hypothetical protein
VKKRAGFTFTRSSSLGYRDFTGLKELT